MSSELASLRMTPTELSAISVDELRAFIKQATERKNYAETIRLSGVLTAKGDNSIEDCRVAMNRVWIQ
ncbi:MAG: hypothetical protein ACPGUF_04615 [Litorivicinus sp.]